MEKQEKKTKVSGVYLVLAALTVLFAVSLVFLHKTAYEEEERAVRHASTSV